MKNRLFYGAILVFGVFLFLGCSQEADTFYPLKEGFSWQYQLSSSGRNFTMQITNMPARELNGKKVTPQKTDFSGESFFTFISEDNTGIYEYASLPPGEPEPKINTEHSYILKKPIRIGTTWEEKTETQLVPGKVPYILKQTITSVDETVTTPAGTFNGCVKIEGTGKAMKNMGILGKGNIEIEMYQWLAKGVGMVKYIKKEKSNHLLASPGPGEMSIQLASFKKK